MENAKTRTVVEYASAFDLINVKYRKVDLVKHIKQLQITYGKDYTHTIKGDAAKGNSCDYVITDFLLATCVWSVTVTF